MVVVLNAIKQEISFEPEEKIIHLQIRLNGKLARDTEAGYTKKEIYEAFALTMSKQLMVPTSPGWVEKLANGTPWTLLNISLGRYLALKAILDNDLSIW